MRQHSKPIYTTPSVVFGLTPVDPLSGELSEQWLQDLIHHHGHTLPISEIEPVFSEGVSLCKELETPSGFCDNVLVNDGGYVTIVECKLWRNPESRRKVVAQVLDYAKDFTKFGYSDFENAVLKARNEGHRSLFEIMREHYPDIDESEFTDNLSRNLREARLLLLIVGNGIRENAEELVGFLNNFAQMKFVLSLIEMPVFRVGDSEDHVVTPRILAKTTEIERNVAVDASDRGTSPSTTRERPQSASEVVFFERLSQNIGAERSSELKSFVEELKASNSVKTTLGRGKRLSFNIKTENERFNLASIQEDGQVWFYGIVPRAEELGNRELGLNYLRQMAAIIDGTFDDRYKDWVLCVKKDGRYPDVREYLDKKAEWKELLESTIEQLKRAEQE